MKKYIFIILAVLSFAFASCVETDEEAGGTAVEKMSGYWTVTVDAVDDNGDTVYEDFFGLEKVHVNTYNTASNSTKEMWIDDNYDFWEYKIKVDIDYTVQTFTSNGLRDNEIYDCKVDISGGKILLGAATTPNGMPADSIVYFVSFDDDTYPSTYGYAKYKVSGYRYTGFSGDN